MNSEYQNIVLCDEQGALKYEQHFVMNSECKCEQHFVMNRECKTRSTL